MNCGSITQGTSKSFAKLGFASRSLDRTLPGHIASPDLVFLRAFPFASLLLGLTLERICPRTSAKVFPVACLKIWLRVEVYFLSSSSGGKTWPWSGLAVLLVDSLPSSLPSPPFDYSPPTQGSYSGQHPLSFFSRGALPFKCGEMRPYASQSCDLPPFYGPSQCPSLLAKPGVLTACLYLA